MSQNPPPEQNPPVNEDVQAALDEEGVAAIPPTLENDACELQPVDGRDLFHFAVFKDASRKRKDRDPDHDLNPRDHRKLRIDNGGAVNQKWRRIEGDRRTWHSTAHQWWPPHWEGPKVKVQPFDVFCNDDEVHYSWQNFPQYSEDTIKTRYRVGQWHDLEDKTSFVKEARRINHAKGYRYNIKWWRPYFFGDRKLDPEHINPQIYRKDVRLMKSVFGDIPSEWKWYYAGHLGGGTFGTAVRYDCIDQNKVIKRRIVAKRDHYFQYTADVERAIGAKLKDRSNYILKYLNPSTRAAQGSKGITYTEFAPYGDLSSLFSMYSVAGWVLPEPFCWYLLHCLAEASYVLENGEAPTSEGSSRDPSDPSGTRGWKPLFHVDLKPGNIFLKDPAENPAYWWQRNYPVPVMADFGGAARYPNDQSKRPAYFKCPPESSGALKGKYAYEDDTWTVDAPNHHVSGAGSRGYRSFELLDVYEQRLANEHRREANVAEGATNFAETLPEGQPIRIHTTIFQIGSVLCKGMRSMAYFHNLEQLWWDHAMENPSTGEKGWVEDPHSDYQNRHQKRFPTAELRRPGKDNDGIGVEPYSPRFSLSPHYSHELVDLVFKCMHPLHDHRPTPKELWDETNKMMAEIDRIWPEPDPNIPTPATSGSEDDAMDYRSVAAEEETDEKAEERQDKVIVDPRDVELYENIREQYVDVDATRVPKIWRSRHQEPTREAVLQLQYKQQQMHRLRQKRRDKEHSENLRSIREKRAYLLGLNDYLHQAKERLRRGRNGWDAWNEEEKNKRLNLFSKQFRRSRKKAGETIFSDRDVEGFDVEDPDPEPPPTPEERSEDESEFQGHPDLIQGQTSGGVAESNGRLLRHGPRMVALEWDFQPLGAQMLVGDQYAIFRKPVLAPRDYGDMDSDESVASVSDLAYF